jgi:hypothetical protein
LANFLARRPPPRFVFLPVVSIRLPLQTVYNESVNAASGADRSCKSALLFPPQQLTAWTAMT